VALSLSELWVVSPILAAPSFGFGLRSAFCTFVGGAAAIFIARTLRPATIFQVKLQRGDFRSYQLKDTLFQVFRDVFSIRRLESFFVQVDRFLQFP
jgi:hypothetical protein